MADLKKKEDDKAETPAKSTLTDNRLPVKEGDIETPVQADPLTKEPNTLSTPKDEEVETDFKNEVILRRTFFWKGRRYRQGRHDAAAFPGLKKSDLPVGASWNGEVVKARSTTAKK